MKMIGTSDIIIGILIALKIADLTTVSWPTIIVLLVMFVIIDAVLDLIHEALTSWRENRRHRNGAR